VCSCKHPSGCVGAGTRSKGRNFHLNRTDASVDLDNDRQHHAVWAHDYTVTIPIRGQSKLESWTIDGDGHQVTNNGWMTVPGVKTPQPYNGNFPEFTVKDVTATTSAAP
jgi:hypothetical protein